MFPLSSFGKACHFYAVYPNKIKEEFNRLNRLDGSSVDHV